MKDPNAQAKTRKPRKPAAPKPIFIVVDGECPVLGVFRKAEEVLKVLEENPNAKYTKFMVSPVNTAS